MVECCYETPALAFGFESLATLFKVGIKLWQILPEVVYSTLEERVGYEQMLLNISFLYLVSCLTGENYEFADYVLAREVDTWVGFAEISLKMKLSVPLSTASIFNITSPELRRSLMVPMIGSPAPTLVS